MDINHNLITGCKLCEVFFHIDDYELIFPKSKDQIDKEDYIIILCKECGDYILILRDHTEYITNELFGKILYSTRKIISNSIKIDTNLKHSFDHFHCHIKTKENK